MSRKKSILLLGNYRPSLTLARRFNELGFDVVVGAHGCERLCQYSSAVSAIWDHSPLNNGLAVFAEELKSYVAANPELTAIYPVAEEYVRLFAKYEEAFDGLPSIVTLDRELVGRCLDKPFMLTLANSVGVDTAPFSCVSGLAETIEVLEHSVGFPVVIRPKDSTERLEGSKALTLNNVEELINCFDSHQLERRELLVQRKFEGKRHNIYFAAVDGKITRLLHAVIDRTDKIDGTGLAVEGRTLEPTGDLVHQTSKLLVAMNYSGIGCAQFLVDERTGQTSFLEINPRVAGNHALPEHAGLDLGLFNYERVVLGREDMREVTAPAGIRYCWTTGDLMGAKVAYLRSEIGFSALLSWLGKALISMLRSHVHMVFSLKDPYPALRGIWNLVPRIARWKKPEVSPGENTIYSDKQRTLT